MSIIEREIEKRQTLIDEAKNAQEEAKALREQADKLADIAASIDVDTLQAEVDELKGYLPKPCEAYNVLGVDTAEAETVEETEKDESETLSEDIG